MKQHRILLVVFLIIICFVVYFIFFQNLPHEKDQRTIPKNYSRYLDSAYRFCVQRQMNTGFFFLIDLSRHSGEQRFYVYDFTRHQITDSFLVSHGCGNNRWSGTQSRQKARIDFKDGSHCSETGKFELSDRSYSNWGVHVKYWMKGLDKQNSNAMRRQIVFHSWSRIEDKDIFPEGTPEGWGCPAVSDATFRYLDQKLISVKKNTLMWIIN